MGDTQPAPEALAADVRLVKLIEREIVLDAAPSRAAGDGQDGSILPSVLQIPQTDVPSVLQIPQTDVPSVLQIPQTDVPEGPDVPRAVFPAVAETIADGIEQQASARTASVIRLASRMPQEIGAGLGIRLGQRSATGPARVRPVHYSGGCLPVPRLGLGRGSVPAGRR